MRKVLGGILIAATLAIGVVAAPRNAQGVTNFVQDTFTAADGTAVNARTGELGATWTVPSYVTASSPIITSNRARTSGSTSFAYASGVPSSSEYSVQATFRLVTDEVTNAGIIGRLSTTVDTHYIVRYASDVDQWQLRKTVNGAATSLGTWSETLSPGNERTVRLEITDATKKVFIDGVERISSADNEITAAGRAAMRFTATGGATTGIHIDDFTAYTPGGSSVVKDFNGLSFSIIKDISGGLISALKAWNGLAW